MVGKRDRLRALKMSVARHDRIDLVFGPVDKRPRKLEDGMVERIEAVHSKETEVESDLVIATARGVQFSCDFAGDLVESVLHGGMDVLDIVGGHRKRTPLDLSENALEAVHDRPRLPLFQHALAAKHSRVRDAPANVVDSDAQIESKGACEPEHAPVQRHHETP